MNKRSLFGQMLLLVVLFTGCGSVTDSAANSSPSAPTASIAPSPPAISIPAGFPALTYQEHVTLDHVPCSSEEEANRSFLRYAQRGYFHFGIFVEDLSMLHTEEEYLTLYPEVLSLNLKSLTKYRNGYYLEFTDTKTIQADIIYRYVHRTGDTSVLTESENHAYQKLFEIAEELKLSELNDIDAVLAAHDYLVLHTAYDETALLDGDAGISNSVEGTLLHGLSVCSGYAATFRLLMDLAGIPCEYVQNDVHAWNLVQLEGEWYHVDVTWDDPAPDQPGIVTHTHFMMTDEEISQLKDHNSWNCECRKPHNCKDSSYRIYPYQNYLCSEKSQAMQLIQQQADSNSILLLYPTNSGLTEEFLLDLTLQTLHLTGDISYYPSIPQGNSYFLLRILINE